MKSLFLAILILIVANYSPVALIRVLALDLNEVGDSDSDYEAYRQIRLDSLFGDQLPPSYDSERCVTLVGTVDGYLHGMNADGRVIWAALVPGGPMAQSHYSNEREYDSSEYEYDKGAYGARSRRPIAVIPTVDGSVIIHSSEGMRKTASSVQGLIDRAPYASKEGGLVFTGVKQSRLIGLDLDTGAIIQDTGSNSGSDSGRDSGSDNDKNRRDEEWRLQQAITKNDTTHAKIPRDQRSENSEASVSVQSLVDAHLTQAKASPSRRLWVGRIDYTMRAYDENTGREEFNFTYSELMPINSTGFRVNLQQGAPNAGEETDSGRSPVASASSSARPFSSGSSGGGSSSSSRRAETDGNFLTKNYERQAQLPLVSTADGDLYFLENSNAYNDHTHMRDGYSSSSSSSSSAYRSKHVSLGSPVTCAFELSDYRLENGGRGGSGGGGGGAGDGDGDGRARARNSDNRDYIEINRRKVVHSIDAPDSGSGSGSGDGGRGQGQGESEGLPFEDRDAANRRVRAPPNSLHSQKQELESQSESETEGNTVVVRYHKGGGGGLYALEISPPVVAHTAQAQAQIGLSPSGENCITDSFGALTCNSNTLSFPTTGVRIGKGTLAAIASEIDRVISGKQQPILRLLESPDRSAADPESDSSSSGTSSENALLENTKERKIDREREREREGARSKLPSRDMCIASPRSRATYAERVPSLDKYPDIDADRQGMESDPEIGVCPAAPLVGTHRLHSYISHYDDDDDDDHGGANQFLDPRRDKTEGNSHKRDVNANANANTIANANASISGDGLDNEHAWTITSQLHLAFLLVEKTVVRLGMQVLMFYLLLGALRRTRVPLPPVAEACIAFIHDKILLRIVRSMIEAGVDPQSLFIGSRGLGKGKGKSRGKGEGKEDDEDEADTATAVIARNAHNGSGAATSASTNESSDVLVADENGILGTRVGALHMTNTILGYGSQGTIVLKGSLNGRPVAVKRMLSQLHHSAEREISLLIRSDGHPNVVRYFLRERKGEFVYLALQLCRMSLREFILRLQKYSSANEAATATGAKGKGAGKGTAGGAGSANKTLMSCLDVSEEVKGAMLQICKGVAHLHSQRIVHRDIKPHNILCALPDEVAIALDAAAAGLVQSRGGSSAAAAAADAGDIGTGSHKHSSVVVSSMDQLSSYVLKISDMGLSKQLDAGEGSFESMSLSIGPLYGEGSGSNRSSETSAQQSGNTDHLQLGAKNPVGTIGWQAPELLALRDSHSRSAVVCAFEEGGEEGGEEGSRRENETACAPQDPNGAYSNSSSHSKFRLTQMLDIFSLGCVLHYVLLPGEHPYGQWYEREANIMGDRADLSRLKNAPDALDLVQRMLRREQHLRPSATEVCDHPFFWTASKRLDFLTDLSDRLEHEPANADVMQAIELNSKAVLGAHGWDAHLGAELLEDMGRYRRYDTTSVRDLLRVIRNKKHHFYELPEAAKAAMSPLPGGFQAYFDSRFPSLVLHCVKITSAFLPNDKISDDYCKSCVRMFAKDKPPPPPESKSKSLHLQLRNALRSQILASNQTTVQEILPSTDSDAQAPPQKTLDFAKANAGGKGPAAVSASPQTLSPQQQPQRQWTQSAAEWAVEPSCHTQKGIRPSHLNRSSVDGKYRSRLCTHWADSGGTACPMRKRGKCDFAHGPLELRVKETRRDVWANKARLLRLHGSSSSSSSSAGSEKDDNSALARFESAGEDVLGAARLVEQIRFRAANEGVGGLVGVGVGVSASVPSFGPQRTFPDEEITAGSFFSNPSIPGHAGAGAGAVGKAGKTGTGTAASASASALRAVGSQPFVPKAMKR